MSATTTLLGLLGSGSLAGLIKLGLRIANRGPGGIDRAAVVGDLLIVGDVRTERYGTYEIVVLAERRLGTRRLADGTLVARITEENERPRRRGGERDRGDGGIRLLGATGDLLWCSSRELPVHQRRPASLEVVAGGNRLPALKPLDGSDDPVFDLATGRVHAYALDGRGLSIGPDLDTVEAPRPKFARAPSEIERVDEIAVAGGSRIWLSGHDEDGERRLRGLGDVRVFRAGKLLVTPAHRGLPVLVAHRDPLARSGADQLSAVTQTSMWTATFQRSTIARARHLVVAGDRLVLLTEKPCEALALDAASGTVLWRVRL